MDEIIRETKRHIEEIGREVLWIGSANGEYVMSSNEFFKLESQIYDSGYGGQEVADDLVIVFTDGSWSERHEYDGSECWKHNTKPIKKGTKVFTRVVGGNWNTLKEIQSKG